MMEVLKQGGTLAQLAFGLGLVGVPLTVLAGGVWYRRRPMKAAALAAVQQAQESGLDPWNQYLKGRDAALAAAHPRHAALLMFIIATWVLTLVILALMALLREPSPLVVTDVLRGNLQLPTHLSLRTYLGLVSRSLMGGSMVTLMLIPVVSVSGLAFGFLRSWLMGGPLDETLVEIIDRVDPEKWNDELQKISQSSKATLKGRWTLTGLLMAPVWFLIRGQYKKGLWVVVAWVVCLAVGLLVWFIPARWVWESAPLLSGTNAGVLWHYLRDTILLLCALPVWLYVGTRGNR